MSRLLVPAAVVAGIGAPFVLDVFQIGLVTRGLTWGLVALSIWFLLRLLDQPSFGHAAFFGTGAYVAGLSVTRWQQDNVFVILALAVLVTAVVALPIALIASRLDSIGFLLVTLAFAEMLRSLALRWRVLGGSDGLVGVTRPGAGPFGIDLTDPVTYFYFALVVTAACVTGLWLVRRSSFGGVLVAIRESESRMRALGYHVGAYKVAAFLLSAAVAAVGGVLNAYLVRFVSPDDLGPLVSARGLVIVVVAGGLLTATVLVAVLLTFGEDLASSHTEHWLAVMGALYVAVALLEGIRGSLARRPSAPVPDPVQRVAGEAS